MCTSGERVGRGGQKNPEGKPPNSSWSKMGKTVCRGKKGAATRSEKRRDWSLHSGGKVELKRSKPFGKGSRDDRGTWFFDRGVEQGEDPPILLEKKGVVQRTKSFGGKGNRIGQPPNVVKNGGCSTKKRDGGKNNR